MTAAAKHIRTSTLDVAYEESGAAGGVPVFLMHGWPYDPRCYDEVIPPLAAAGCRIIVPYLRGFGATRFLSADTPRSGQQAALGNDLRELMDALAIERAVLAGYDWGGRAACIVAALWPERVRGLVTVNSYNIQNIAAAMTPAGAGAGASASGTNIIFTPSAAAPGSTPTAARSAACCGNYGRRSGRSTTPTFERSAVSFDNPDFVAVTIQSYRHRFGYAAGDPALEAIEARLAAQPKIAVPTIALQGEADGVHPPEASAKHAAYFTGPYQRRVLPRIGHNPPQEAPQVFADAILELITRRSLNLH